ncbi:bifunctional 4-hydroxy-2-oxoglutarate aldolase/2-dehydro-3-deoxy-phosphogluconate aldolase [Candidatus Solirubrobacter pratensis]|uniref:bifunctional 4-hydroxy-2-oxoglutarate aldolase/2-dehydro-3-deoxy-phosphogluconate aldolase n=1 Tax=Candidatus Solirubrobacter pratensis TaxID=1298857 RepID=UPI00040A0EAC|nr:bifunctional 4-hydroxy-2-oxoglutarate aldolase/2-dehydro-3-deoxy-phosphogluconate aldolase [Candidatus Solirubrobacter pratensis]
MTADELLDLGPVIPVVVLEDAGAAVPLARTLVDAGMRAIEITLRTPAALEAIANVAADVPDAVVGAGTVLSPAQAQDALAAGAQFLVAPGSTPALLDRLAGMPLLPGAVTASEVMALLERGITWAKFFPAESSGGVRALKALAGPFPQMRFCPTGGIDAAKAKDYLALPNVACVGGSWMLPPPAVQAGDWERIRELATAPSSTA